LIAAYVESKPDMLAITYYWVYLVAIIY